MGIYAELTLQRSFRWVAIRVFFARMLHSIIAAAQWLVKAVVYRLDYARRFRWALDCALCERRVMLSVGSLSPGVGHAAH